MSDRIKPYKVWGSLLNFSLALALGLGPAQTTAAASNSSTRFDFQTIATLDEQVPGQLPGVVFSSFDDAEAVLNANGHVAFKARIAGPGIDDSNFRGIWSNAGGSLQAVVQRGETWPVFPGGIPSTFGDFRSLWLSDNGEVTFGATQNNNISLFNYTGYWTQRSAGLQPIVIDHNPVPGITPTATFDGPYSSSERPTISNVGLHYKAIQFEPAPFEADSGIYVSKPTGLFPVVSEGDPAPGLAPGATFGQIGSIRVSTNGLGHAFFPAPIRGIDGFDVPGATLWTILPNGTVELVAKKGDPVPGPQPGLTFTQFRSIKVNDADNVAFIARVEGPGIIMDVDDIGLWKDVGSGLEYVMKQGNATAGVIVTDIPNSFYIDGLGQVTTNVSTTAEDAIISEATGVPTVLAVQGSTITLDGETFTTALNRSISPASNGVGDLIFLFEGANPGQPTQRVLAIQDELGNFHSIIRQGDLIDISNDPLIQDLRTVLNFSGITTGVEDGALPNRFNNDGQIVLNVLFNDDTEAIMVATIPEPASLALLAFAGFALLGRRHPTQLH